MTEWLALCTPWAWPFYAMLLADPDDDDRETWYPIVPDGGPPVQWN